MQGDISGSRRYTKWSELSKSFKPLPPECEKDLPGGLRSKTAAIRELRTVVRQYPGTDEPKRSAAKLGN